MKAYFLLSVTVFSVTFINKVEGVSRDQMEKMAQGFRNSCVNKIGADLELVKGIREGKFTEGDQKLKCYTKCIMTTMKTFKDGKLDLPMALKQINIMASDDVAGRLVDVAKKCYGEVSEEDPCEFTWQYTKCLYNGDPEVFFFP